MCLCMKNKLITWTPRILSILLLILLFMMSFDVFDIDDAWYMLILGFLIHNIPVFVLLITLYFSWKRPIIGGVVFISVGIFYAILMIVRSGWDALLSVLSLGVLAIVIGVLFLVDHYIRHMHSS